ncbi:MAG: signal peptidase I [Clostridia bacterium]|nr:signal peptidase I [Clostridia bacterium]
MNQIKRIFQLASTIMVILALLVAFFLVGIRLIGLYPYTVLSGSMEPTYHVGSIIYVKKVDPLTLTVGDPITFTLNNTVVTHRIIEVIEDENDPAVRYFRTKGDNNDVADGGDGVHCNNVIGKPVFSVPYLGYLAVYLQSSSGRYLLFGLCAVLLLSTVLPSGKNKKSEADSVEGDTSDTENADPQ